MKVQDALAIGRDKLAHNEIDGAARDARWLMAASLGVKRDRISLILCNDLSEKEESVFFHHIVRRGHNEPISCIIQGRDFFGRWFHITKDVLDPRPETECLIEVALQKKFDAVLDLGTGSGCILLTLLAERPEASGVGTDKSTKALAVAEWNAKDLGLTDQCALIESDWFHAVEGTFDLIVSNPPYISEEEMKGLAPEVLNFDPRMALTDEGDGLGEYRKLAAGIVAHLKPDGRALLEIGPAQADDVIEIFNLAGSFNSIVHKDLDGRDRVIELSFVNNPG